MDRTASPDLFTIGNAVLITAILILILLAIVVAVPGVIGAKASYVVKSDSMAPEFESGDLVFVESVAPEDISTGDIITYHDPNTAGDDADRISHRVIQVTQSNGEYVFRTKGDANDNPDPYQVKEPDITGQVWFSIPAIGHAVHFAGTPIGMILFIVIPGLLLVVTELWSLFKDASEGVN